MAPESVRPPGPSRGPCIMSWGCFVIKPKPLQYARLWTPLDPSRLPVMVHRYFLPAYIRSQLTKDSCNSCFVLGPSVHKIPEFIKFINAFSPCMSSLNKGSRFLRHILFSQIFAQCFPQFFRPIFLPNFLPNFLLQMDCHFCCWQIFISPL